MIPNNTFNFVTQHFYCWKKQSLKFMTSCKQSDSQFKRTSHYYKKKLNNTEYSKITNQLTSKIAVRIQKTPKEPKLRAKQARQRKKQYIEKLEDKITQLQKQLNIYKERTSAIQSTHSAFINLNKAQKPAQTSLEVKSLIKKAQTAEYCQEVIKLAGIQNAFRHLYAAVQMKNREEAEGAIEVLRQRFGIAGQERVKWFEELLLKIVSIMMPMHCRLLLQNCQNRQEFYKLIGCSESMKQERKLYFEKDTISRLCQSRPAMVQIKEQYKKIISNIAELSDKMGYEANRLQKQVDKIEKSMNPLFVGRILVDLDVERKKVEDLNEIFPVNHYKQTLARSKQCPQQVKNEQEEPCFKSIDQDQLMGRVQGFSDQEYYLLGMLLSQ